MVNLFSDVFLADILTGAKFEGDYKKWISEVSNRFKTSQIKASIKVNDEMLRFVSGFYPRVPRSR